MGLSAERMAALEDHYEVWGLEEACKELECPDRDEFTDPEVTAVAQAWLELKEATARRKRDLRNAGLATIGVGLLGLAIILVRALRPGQPADLAATAIAATAAHAIAVAAGLRHRPHTLRPRPF